MLAAGIFTNLGDWNGTLFGPLISPIQPELAMNWPRFHHGVLSILVEFLNPPFNVGFEAVITGLLREIQCSFKIGSRLYNAF